MYILVIFMVYTWYIPVICRCHTYGGYIRCKTFLGLFLTFFYNDIPLIFHEYSFDIQIYQRYIIIKKGMEQAQFVFTTYIPTICMTSTYDWNISCIHHVYNKYILLHTIDNWHILVYTICFQGFVALIAHLCHPLIA